MIFKPLLEVGSVLFGPRWPLYMARELRVPETILKQWMSGEVRISENTAADIQRQFRGRDPRIAAPLAKLAP